MKFANETKACIASILAISLFTMLCTSCTTAPKGVREMVWIPGSQITEEELQRRGVHYEKSEFDNEAGYFVETRTLNKFCDYTLEASENVISFATKGIVVVGVLVLMFPELWMPSSVNVSRGTPD
ncbi:hypothetical protein [Pontiella sulfatireligans]|uniref:Uncharacterized protein n=1 Tax=Pontiella sulfatireligans TaxID=2750658 RepID=A0A6C2UIM0_9BACT|nr:hypothetical protein [Pontiella sulfatireligans]VGO19958.1 hypothetical protein SCARR_02018 [Pontiella sulfatireligans]